MGIRSFLKNIINMWPMYRQGERQCQYLRRIKELYEMQLLTTRREQYVHDDILQLKTDKGTLSLYVPEFPQNNVTDVFVLYHEFPERDLLNSVRPYIPDNGVVIDVGANIGSHTLYFAWMLNTSKVYSFEPQKGLFPILQKNCELNNILDKVVLYNCCVGEKEAYASLGNVAIYDASQTSFNMSDTPTDYKIMSLDSLKLDKVDFIKIDVEGHEIEVLRGAKETIARCKPVIWCEAWTPEQRKTLHRFLKPYGYCVNSLNDSNHLFTAKR